jgi:G3E family GTPase
VLENSGVAEPQNIRDQFNEAIAAGNPLMHRIYLDTLVTIVDAGTFIHDYSSRTPLAARPDLGEGGNLRPVVDLLVEQIECVAPFGSLHMPVHACS